MDHSITVDRVHEYTVHYAAFLITDTVAWTEVVYLGPVSNLFDLYVIAVIFMEQFPGKAITLSFAITVIAVIVAAMWIMFAGIRSNYVLVIVRFCRGRVLA